MEEINVISIFTKGKKEDLKNYKFFSFTCISVNLVKQIILEIFFRHMKDIKVIRSSQDEFPKGTSRLTKLGA